MYVLFLEKFAKIVKIYQCLYPTRMHSSRMCTACSLTVSRSICHACSPTMHAPYMHTPYHAHHPCHACSPATHAPLPCMPPCDTCPPAMHSPAMHAPLPCTPPTMHAPAKHAPHHTHTPLPCTPPCHACPPVDRILDTRFWKYYLAPTSLRAVKIYWKSSSWQILNLENWLPDLTK